MASIMIVDDYFVTQRVLTYMLQKCGHTIVNAVNGQDALDKLATTPIDLAIVDVAMPIMDGLSLLKHIRADSQLHGLPIIVLTASGDDQHRLISAAEGAEAFLHKPVSSHELIATVSACLAPDHVTMDSSE